MNEINMDNRISDSVVNFLTRKESPEDIRNLKKWLAEDPVHRDELKQWLEAWDMAGMAVDAGRYHPSGAYQRFMFRLQKEKASGKKSGTSRIFRMVRRVAAVFIVSFLSGILCHYYWVGMHPVETAFIENVTPLGSRSEIRLPDGSTVWLNAGSKLRYSTGYGHKTRDIYLEGEGYFKVARLEEKPFMVHTEMMTVKALGTEFNVKAYAGEGGETTLIEGEVLVDNGRSFSSLPESVLLKPGQKLKITAPTQEMNSETKAGPATDSVTRPLKPVAAIEQLNEITAHAEVSWKDRYWRIEKEELQSLGVKLERRYDVRIRIDDRLKSYRFTGTIRDESLEQVLIAMQFSAPILFTVNGKEVVIDIDPQKMN